MSATGTKLNSHRLACRSMTSGPRQSVAPPRLFFVRGTTHELCEKKPGETHVVALGLVHVARLVDGSDKERHDVVQIRVVGFQGDVVVPWSLMLACIIIQSITH